MWKSHSSSELRILIISQNGVTRLWNDCICSCRCHKYDATPVWYEPCHNKNRFYLQFHREVLHYTQSQGGIVTSLIGLFYYKLNALLFATIHVLVVLQQKWNEWNVSIFSRCCPGYVSRHLLGSEFSICETCMNIILQHYCIMVLRKCYSAFCNNRQQGWPWQMKHEAVQS